MEVRSLTLLQRYKICYQLFPRIRQHAFRMELHSLNREVPMAQAHDDAGAVFFCGPGAYFQFGGEIAFLDDERMIARSCHGHGKTLKDSFVVVYDGAGLAVHKMGGAHHASTEGFANCLMPQANSEHRDF